MSRIAFLVTHLVGTGHLVRTLALARAVAAAGGTPLVISGGRPLPHLDREGLELVQIPHLTVPDFDFANPKGPDGRAADDALRAARRAAILEALTAFAPDVLVTETFPLGRRRLAAEFEAAIAAVPGAAVVCSVRDVPEPPASPDRLAEAADRLSRLYDAVLVHGDAQLIPLRATWDLPETLAPRIHHTGYVGHANRAGSAKGQWVLVSGGGGPLGRGMMEVALNAAANSPRIWHMITGGETAEKDAEDFTYTQYGVFAHPPREDFRRLLASAACSVSLCGYNTVMDLAAVNTPAILVPFEGHGQREQRLRADALSGMPGITVMGLEGLTPQALNEAIEAAIRGPGHGGLPEHVQAMMGGVSGIGHTRPPMPLDTGGAARAAERLLALGAARRG